MNTNPVLLVSCYELGQQPLGIAVSAGILRRAGFDVGVMDLSVQSLDEARILSAQFIGISAPMHTALRIGYTLARRIREINPSAHICFYGLYAELNHEAVMHVADSVLGAESEALIASQVSAVLTRSPLPSADNSNNTNGLSRAGRELDLTPDRSGLDHSGYTRLVHNERVAQVGALSSTRGCKHLCTHCPLPASYAGRFYALPVNAIMSDVASLVTSGATHITFTDPDFLNGPTHALRIARELHIHHPDVTFDYTSKIEHLKQHYRTVETLQQLGNIFVISAVESFDDTVLRHLAKGHTRQDTLEVFRHFQDIDLTLRPTFVPFTPWESGVGFIDILDTIAEHELVENVDPVQYMIRLLVPPSSLLLNGDAMTPHLGAYDATTLSWIWRHPDPSMDTLQSTLASIVEEASLESIETTMTFDRIRKCAADVLGSSKAVAPYWGSHPRRTPPRMTEPWFC